MKNKLWQILILAWICPFILMGLSSTVDQALRDMINEVTGDFKYIQINGVRFNETTIGGSGEANTASNVGTGTASIFKQKSGVDLQFKTLVPGSAITFGVDASNITINTTALTSGTTTPRINTEYDVDGNGKIDDVESIPNHWTSNDDIIIQAANNKPIDLIVQGNGSARIQYGSETPRPINVYRIGVSSTPISIPPSTDIVNVYSGTITGSSDTDRAIDVEYYLTWERGATNTVSFAAYIGGTSIETVGGVPGTESTPLRSNTAGVFHTKVMLLGSTSSQLVTDSGTAPYGPAGANLSALTKRTIDFSIDQPIKIYVQNSEAGAIGTSTVTFEYASITETR